MAIKVVADTHAIIWYLYNDSRLSNTALQTMDRIVQSHNQIAISAITLAEMIYLMERNRINNLVLERTITILGQSNSPLVEIPFDKHIAVSMQKIKRNEIPELPDRIITATARYLKVPIISRDQKIQASTIETIW